MTINNVIYDTFFNSLLVDFCSNWSHEVFLDGRKAQRPSSQIAARVLLPREAEIVNRNTRVVRLLLAVVREDAVSS